MDGNNNCKLCTQYGMQCCYVRSKTKILQNDRFTINYETIVDNETKSIYVIVCANSTRVRKKKNERDVLADNTKRDFSRLYVIASCGIL